MVALKIFEVDLDEKFVGSSGKGGQNVNRVATCVMLSHKPSGISVRVDKARTQGLNRYLARQLIVEKIEERLLGRESKRRKDLEKKRRQKRKRSARAKRKMVDAKKRHGKMKALRGEKPAQNDS